MTAGCSSSSSSLLVFFILIIIAGVAAWLFVLAQESRRVAEEETRRQTDLLMNEIEAHKRTDAKLQKAKEAAVKTTTESTPDDAIDDAQTWVNRKASAQATRAANARQASGRRRFVDPTTCEREYSMAEIEFMQAMHDYKQSSGRMFPTWSEVLEVIKALGYEKALSVPGLAMQTETKPGRIA